MQGLSRYRRSFGIVFTCSMLTFVLTVASLNYAIDPYNIFRSLTLQGINALKPRPDVMLGDIKLIVGTRFHPTALILGNSRADVGFDPTHPAFGKRHLRAYNAAVPGSGLDYSLEAFQRLGNTAEIEFAIIGVDFLDFLHSPQPDAQPRAASSAFSASSTRTHLVALLSITALVDSIRTLLVQREANPAIVRSDGFNPMLDYREIAAAEGYSALFRQRAQETARNLSRQPHNLYIAGRRMSPSFAALRLLLQTAREKGTDVALVIYPYHVLLMLQYEAAGLWPLFEQWKEDITAISEEARLDGTHVRLWDFACPSELTAEPVPRDGDRASAMQWYWEGGHFKKELGDLVLNNISGRGAPSTFGFELTVANVDDRNRTCREALEAMRERVPSLARLAAELSRSAESRPLH